MKSREEILERIRYLQDENDFISDNELYKVARKCNIRAINELEWILK